MPMLKILLKIIAAMLMLAIIVVISSLIYFGWRAGERETQTSASMAPASGRYVKALNLDLFIQEAGPADGQAVLLVHGTGAWSETWRPTMKVLADAGFHAIAIDLPPFGFSQRPDAADYDKSSQGKRIVGILDALKIEQVFLVGHSFGGGPTMEAGLQIPSRVRGIVLVDAALSIADTNDNLTMHEPASGLSGVILSTPFVRDRVVATFLTSPLFTRKLLTLFIDNPDRATDNWVKLYQRPLNVSGTTPAISKWLPELLAPVNLAASEKPDTYRRTQIPLSLIWGDRDTITPISQAHYLVGIAPRAKLTVMTGIGHIPQIENGAAFNALLVEQLKQWSAATNKG
jgi:pimeloyl-ACP methyl ester carboxylesterase